MDQVFNFSSDQTSRKRTLIDSVKRRSKINRPTSLFIASPVSAEPLTTTRNEKSVKELSLILEKEKENVTRKREKVALIKTSNEFIKKQIEILKTRQSSLLDTLANEKAVIRRLESEIERERQNVRGMKDQNEGEKNRIESVKKNFLKQIDSEREDLKAIITKLQESIEKRTVQVDQMNKISEKLTGREYKISSPRKYSDVARTLGKSDFRESLESRVKALSIETHVRRESLDIIEMADRAQTPGSLDLQLNNISEFMED